jgi:hypothetical protein
MSVSAATVTPISEAAHAAKPKTWFDGELIDSDALQAGLTTHAMHYGSGVFEGIRAMPPPTARRCSACPNTWSACARAPSCWAWPSTRAGHRGGAGDAARQRPPRCLHPPAGVVRRRQFRPGRRRPRAAHDGRHHPTNRCTSTAPARGWACPVGGATRRTRSRR